MACQDLKSVPQEPDTKPGSYYVSVVRQPGGNKNTRLLAGPFVDDHAAALVAVDQVRRLATDYDMKTYFDAFGTVRLPSSYTRPGFFNKQMGIPTHTQTHYD